MGLLILIVPLIIYYAIIVPLVKTKLINKKITNKKLKTLAFILLLIFPIGDHIIGYGVYKILCYTNGGVKIYKTVTDVQEQRDYWFKDNLISGILGKDSGQYTDLDRELEKIQKPLYGVYTFYRGDFARGYTNECESKYNTLPKTDLNYKKSCTNADEIIKKYNLTNVIKVPKSPYKYSSSWSRILPLGLTFDTGRVVNYETKEVLGENTEITFWGGWFVTLVTLGNGRGNRCNYLSGNDLKTLVIPNPYKKIKEGK